MDNNINPFTLSLLNDNEKVSLFDMALQISRDTEKDFFEVYKITIDKYISKNKTKNEVVHEESPAIVIEDKKEEQRHASQIDLYKISDFWKFERRSTLLNQIMKMVETAGNGISVRQFIEDARNGVIEDDAHFDIEYNNMNSIESKDLADKLKIVNDISKEITYFRLKSMSDEELLELKNKEAENYGNLNDRMLNGGHSFKSLEEDATTLTFDQLVQMNRNHGAYRPGGLVPNGYDDVYYKANQFVNTPWYEKMSQKIFDQVLEVTSVKEKELLAMDVETFRNYKIGQMKLSKEKMEQYDDDANSLIYVNPEKEQGKVI